MFKNSKKLNNNFKLNKTKKCHKILINELNYKENANKNYCSQFNMS